MRRKLQITGFGIRHSTFGNSELPAVRQRAFTLIELLVVIAMLGILLSILMPSFYAVKKSGYAVKTRAVVAGLTSGILQYKLDTGYFPGQKNLDLKPSTSPPHQFANQGSRFLAHQMLDFTDLNDPKSKYYDYQKGMLIDPANPTNPSPVLSNCAISDGFPNDPRPVLYFPSRIGNEGSLDQYVYEDNDVYIKSDDNSVNGVEGNARQRFYGDSPAKSCFIGMPNSSPVMPVRDGEFLLIGAGGDRKFFTHDDVTNW